MLMTEVQTKHKVTFLPHPTLFFQRESRALKVNVFIVKINFGIVVKNYAKNQPLATRVHKPVFILLVPRPDK